MLFDVFPQLAVVHAEAGNMSMLSLRCLFLLALTTPMACGGGVTLPQAAIDHNLAGAEALAGGELDDAEARFRLALEYHPGFAESRANLGLVAFQRDDLSSAEGHLRAAIRLDPSFDEAWSNLGLVLVAQGNREAGAAAFEEALAIDPGLTEARRNLADLWMQERNYTEARAQLMRLVQIETAETDGGARARAMLAYCETRLGRTAEAHQRAEQVLSVRPNEPLARLVRGITRATTGDLEGALLDYAVAENDPLIHLDVLIRVAAIHLAQNELALAQPVIRVLQNERAEDPAVDLLAAHLAIQQGLPELARRYAEEALLAAPRLHAARQLLARINQDDPNSIESPMTGVDESGRLE